MGKQQRVIGRVGCSLSARGVRSDELDEHSSKIISVRREVSARQYSRCLNCLGAL